MLSKLLTLLAVILISQQILIAQSDSTLALVKKMMESKEYKKAIEILDESKKTDTLDYEGNKLLGLAYQNLFNFTKAFSYFNYAKFQAGYSFEINYLLGKTAILNNNKDFAEETFREILLNDSSNYLATVELAGLLVERKKYVGAKPLLERLTESDTNNTYFMNRLAFCNWKLNKFEEAIELYKKVLSISSFDPTASLQLGKILYDSERYEEAKEILDRSLNGNRSNLGINKLLAETLFKLNKYEAAVVHYTKSLALGDSSSGIFQKLGFSYYFIASSGNMMNEEVFELKMNEAVTALSNSYELDNQNPLTTLYLGICYKELKDYQKAKYFLEETINIIIPEYMVDIYTHLAATYEYQEKYSEAISSYLEAYSYDPGRKILLFYLASAMDRFYADKEIPMIYYKKFLKEDKSENGVLIKYAEERIDKLQEQIHFNGYE